ncbi:MAG: hypothetical protein HC880_04725 [Bacteroidia bacterium]|nr:hypothetical protein [Bacteroidia bacterium]
MYKTQSIRLEPQDRVISFEFVGLHYIYPEANLYAYKLEGVDTRWNYTTADKRQVSYANLPRGRNLIFRVKAANSDKVWGQEEAQIKIYITPLFWEQLWFQMGASCC